MVGVCTIQLNARLKKSVYFTPDHRSEIAHDAVTRAIEMYLKHPDQKSMPLDKRIGNEITFQLHNRKIKAIDQNEVFYDHFDNVLIDLSKQKPTQKEDYLNKVKEDSRVDGFQIVYDIYKGKYYRSIIKAIEKYTPRPWIKAHAVELHTIFIYTRNKKPG